MGFNESALWASGLSIRTVIYVIHITDSESWRYFWIVPLYLALLFMAWMQQIWKVVTLIIEMTGVDWRIIINMVAAICTCLRMQSVVWGWKPTCFIFGRSRVKHLVNFEINAKCWFAILTLFFWHSDHFIVVQCESPVQKCSISIARTLEILQFRTKVSIEWCRACTWFCLVMWWL